MIVKIKLVLEITHMRYIQSTNKSVLAKSDIHKATEIWPW